VILCAAQVTLAKQGSISFLKKRNKKLFSFLVCATGTRQSEQKFFGSFFQKRTAFLALACLSKTG
jgi:hypothetical protein